jgi:hypothetical protein
MARATALRAAHGNRQGPYQARRRPRTRIALALLATSILAPTASSWMSPAAWQCAGFAGSAAPLSRARLAGRDAKAATRMRPRPAAPLYMGGGDPSLRVQQMQARLKGLKVRASCPQPATLRRSQPARGSGTWLGLHGGRPPAYACQWRFLCVVRGWTVCGL